MSSATYQHQYYLNRKTAKAKQRLARQQELREFVNRLKSNPCADCNQSFPPYVMDFDHVRGEKQEIISRLIARGCGVASILKEVEKCDLVCANCHRERTFARILATSMHAQAG